MNTDKEIERLRTAVVTRASRLEKEIELPDFDEGRFDDTAKRGALKLLRTAVSAEKHERSAA
jgi:hypothetical protein